MPLKYFLSHFGMRLCVGKTMFIEASGPFSVCSFLKASDFFVCVSINIFAVFQNAKPQISSKFMTP